MPDVADPPAERRRRHTGLGAEEGQTPAAGPEQQGQDAEQRRLAGAVRAEEHHRLAGLHHEIDARQHRRAGEGAHEALGADRRIAH